MMGERTPPDKPSYTIYLAYFERPNLGLDFHETDRYEYERFSDLLRGKLASKQSRKLLALLGETLSETSSEKVDTEYIELLIKTLSDHHPGPTPEESVLTIYLPYILSKISPESAQIFLESKWIEGVRYFLSQLSVSSSMICTWAAFKRELWDWLIQTYAHRHPHPNGSSLSAETLRLVFQHTRTCFLLLKLHFVICLPGFFDSEQGQTTAQAPLRPFTPLPADLFARWLDPSDPVYQGIQGFKQIRVGLINILMGVNATLFRPGQMPSEGFESDIGGLADRLYDDYTFLVGSMEQGLSLSLPKNLHLGVIMDGNRRWGRVHGDLPGHFFGTQRTEELLRWFLTIPELHELTLYCLSADNLHKRSAEEIQSLERLMSIYLGNLIDQASILAPRLSIRIIGEVDCLNADMQSLVQDLHAAYSPGPFSSEKQHEKSRKVLNLAIAYDPVLETHRKLQSEGAPGAGDTGAAAGAGDGTGAGTGAGAGAGEGDGRNYLESDIDWVIRCGDVHRTSGFFPLSTLYSEWAFLPTLWPDMTYEIFLETLRELSGRQRRFGA